MLFYVIAYCAYRRVTGLNDDDDDPIPPISSIPSSPFIFTFLFLLPTAIATGVVMLALLRVDGTTTGIIPLPVLTSSATSSALMTPRGLIHDNKK